MNGPEAESRARLESDAMQRARSALLKKRTVGSADFIDPLVKIVEEVEHGRFIERVAHDYIRALERLIASFDGHIGEFSPEMHERYEQAVMMRQRYGRQALLPDIRSSDLREVVAMEVEEQAEGRKRVCDTCGVEMSLREFYPINDMRKPAKVSGERSKTCRRCTAEKLTGKIVADSSQVMPDYVPEGRQTLKDRVRAKKGEAT